MIDLDKLCGELNDLLPAAGWPLRRPLKSLMPRHGARCASASWDGVGIATNVSIQLYERENSPVVIVFESKYSDGTVEPYTDDAPAIVAALCEFRWMIMKDLE